MAGARRCPSCDLNWPAGTPTCHICGKANTFAPKAEPASAAELDSARAHAAFEAWLLTAEGKDAERQARLDNDKKAADFAALAAELVND